MSEMFLCRVPRPDATQRLICFPWAGGGAMIYANNWAKIIGEQTEVIGLQLPGRENRMKQPLTTDFAFIVEESCNMIKTEYSDKPFAFWGHSMGALMSVVVGIRLAQKYKLEPSCLFVSGLDAPKGIRPRHKMGAATKTDQELLDLLIRLGGTPKEIFDEPQLRELFFPIIRSDYLFMDNCEYNIDEKKPPFMCPIEVFDGEDDYKKNLEGWSKLTHSREFSVRTLPGGHFYLKDKPNTETIVDSIRQRLKTCANTISGS